MRKEMRTDEGGREDGGGTRVKGVVQAEQVQVPPTPNPSPSSEQKFGKLLQGTPESGPLPPLMGWRCPRKLRDGFQVTTGIHLSPSWGGDKL